MASHQVSVSIDNSKNDSNLIISSASDVHGYWNPAPPVTIAANGAASFVITAGAGFYGAEGAVTYTTADGGTISMTFGDPIVGNNYATVTAAGTSVQAAFQAKAGSSGFQPNSVPAHGNPVVVDYSLI